MNAKLQENVIKHYNAIISFSTGITTFLIFLIGLGRYRAILIFSLFFLLKSLFSYLKFNDKILYFLLLPFFLTSLYFDITFGQISPVFSNFPLIASIVILFIVEMLARNFVKNKLQVISENAIFSICPKCNYDNKYLITQCSNCSYNKKARNDHDEQIKLNGALIDKNILEERNIYQEKGLFKKPSKKLQNILNLSLNESILINLRIFPFISFFKNNDEEIVRALILTTEKIIFIDFLFLTNGWRFKETLSFNEIKEVSISKNKEPVVSLKTESDCYELSFRNFIPHKNKISGIIDCLKKRNPLINVIG